MVIANVARLVRCMNGEIHGRAVAVGQLLRHLPRRL